MDRAALVEVEAYGVARMLGERQHDLREDTYRPAAARRVDIPNQMVASVRWGSRRCMIGRAKLP